MDKLAIGSDYDQSQETELRARCAAVMVTLANSRGRKQSWRALVMIRRRSRAVMTATLGVTAIVLMAGCGGSSSSSSAAGSSSNNSGQFSKKSPLTIGFSIRSAQDPYWQGYV